MVQIPKVKLNNGQEIPIFGLGTWKSKPEEVIPAVEYAIDIGYRHIDCAYLYQNEKDIGVAIANKVAQGTVTRKDLFITSKLWATFHRPEVVESTIKESLNNLQLEYLDLFLMHTPFGYKEGNKLIPTGPNGHEFSDYDYIETWKAMESLVEKGLTKSIGISNFNQAQIERILQNCSVKPVINQIECHPYLNQKTLISFCKSQDIAITAYGPLGSPERPWAKPDDPYLLQDAKLMQIAAELGKTTAQMLLRYQIQRGNITIPKSTNKTRIAENVAIFDFELSSEVMDYIDTFDCNERFYKFEGAINHKYYPFNEKS